MIGNGTWIFVGENVIGNGTCPFVGESVIETETESSSRDWNGTSFFENGNRTVVFSGKDFWEVLKDISYHLLQSEHSDDKTSCCPLSQH